MSNIDSGKCPSRHSYDLSSPLLGSSPKWSLSHKIVDVLFRSPTCLQFVQPVLAHSEVWSTPYRSHNLVETNQSDVSSSRYILGASHLQRSPSRAQLLSVRPSAGASAITPTPSAHSQILFVPEFGSPKISTLQANANIAATLDALKEVHASRADGEDLTRLQMLKKLLKSDNNKIQRRSGAAHQRCPRHFWRR
jgi:hypothetical protein